MFEQYVTDAVHEPTQSHAGGFDLTVGEVLEVEDPGRVDFGGGELTDAGTRAHPSAKRNPEDDYEWWSLAAGQYLIECNESLADDVTATVQPRTELVERGAFHPTVRVGTLPRLALSVGGAGIRIKENARVSTVVDVEA